MARPKKQGLDYFPMIVDFDQDPKLAMVIGQFGYKAEFITYKMLGYLYKNYGFYLPWNEEEQLMFAKRVSYGGSSVNLINEVVVALVRWGFFDEVRFNSSRILTSIDIQQTWMEATRKRKERDIDPAIWLLNESGAAAETKLIPEVTSNGQLFPAETKLIPEVIPQSKVKESKVEIKKESSGTRGDDEPAFQGPTYWEQAKTTFTTNLYFFDQFCVAKRLARPAVARLRTEFLIDLELKKEYMDAGELQKYFTNWFNKGQRTGFIDQQGNLKNAVSTEQTQTVTNAAEQKAKNILSQFD